MKNPYHYIGYLVLISILFIFSCKDDNLFLPEVEITFPVADTTIQFGDSITIYYKADNERLESVTLISNGSPYASLTEAEYFFYFKPSYSGTHTVHVIAEYSSGFEAISHTIDIYSKYTEPPELELACERIDGEETYFVGEQLNITVLPKWEWMDIENFKQVTLYLNEDFLGTLNNPPFIYQTSAIEYPDNSVHIVLLDSNNFTHKIDMELYVPLNTPPDLQFEFKWIYSVRQGYFYSIDSIISALRGEDNLEIHYVDYYLDNQYFSSDTINSGNFWEKFMNFGLLPAGVHTVQCIAYDDRGLSTTSELLSLIIYKTFEIDEQIIDIHATSNSSLAYAVSTKHLFEIDPVNETISRTMELPFIDPTAIAVSDKFQRIFLSFRQGQMVYLEYGNENFIHVETDGITNIEDLEIDEDFNFAIMISNMQLLAMDLATGDYFSCSTALYQGSTLLYDGTANTIIAGGNPDVSAGYIYKFRLTENSIDKEAEAYIGGYADDLFLSPNKKEFLITNSNYNLGYPAYDISNFGSFLGVYETDMSKTAAYSSDGSIVFLGSNLDDEIVSFNSVTFTSSEQYYIPLTGHNSVNHIIADLSDSKLILSTTNVFEEEVKMIIVRQGLFP